MRDVERRRARQRAYLLTPEGKETQRRYASSKKGRERDWRYRHGKTGRATYARWKKFRKEAAHRGYVKREIRK